ncbi:MAG: alpha/beta hydrolase [Patescibacteria group bacterium]|jgi:pimeloyl-ACP methyl ester carboxylesterase
MFIKRNFTLSDGETITYGIAPAENQNRPVLILLPGQKKIEPGQLSKDFIPEQYEYLQGKFQVIMWNYRFKNYPGEKTNVSRMVKDLEEFAKAKKIEKLTVYAYSYGGLIGLEFCHINPEKVNGIILLSTFARFSFTHFGFNKMTWRFFLHLMVVPSASSSHIRESMYSDFRQKPSGYHGPAGKFLDWMWHTGLDTVWNHFWSERVWSALKADLRPILPEIKTPALIVAGRADALCPVEWAETLHKGLSNSEMEIFDDAGHYAVRVWPDKFNQRIRKFLQERLSVVDFDQAQEVKFIPELLKFLSITKKITMSYFNKFRSLFA